MTNADTLLNQIRVEAHRIQQSEQVDLVSAYDRAIRDIIMITAESSAVDPFDAALINAVRSAQAKKDGRGVLRSEIRDELELIGMAKIDDWSLWKRAADLEDRKLLFRPSPRLWAAPAA